MIKVNDPVRESFADQSSRNSYYKNKSQAINAFDGVLQTFDLCLDCNDLDQFHDNEGHKMVEVHDEFHNVVGLASLSWFRMSSGCYEFVGYLA